LDSGDINNVKSTLILRIQELENKGIDVPYELFEGMLAVLEFGASKYEANNWLEPNGIKSDPKSMYGSIFRHVAEAYAGADLDKESGLPPEAHAQCRLGMSLARKARGLE